MNSNQNSEQISSEIETSSSNQTEEPKLNPQSGKQLSSSADHESSLVSSNEEISNSESEESSTITKVAEKETEKSKTESKTKEEKLCLYFEEKKKIKIKRSLSVNLEPEGECNSLLDIVETRRPEFEYLERYSSRVIKRLRSENRRLEKQVDFMEDINEELTQKILEISSNIRKNWRKERLGPLEKEGEIVRKIEKKKISKKNKNEKFGAEKTSQISQNKETTTSRLKKLIKELKATILYQNQQIEHFEIQRKFDRRRISKFKSLFFQTKREFLELKLWVNNKQQQKAKERGRAKKTYKYGIEADKNESEMMESEERHHPIPDSQSIVFDKLLKEEKSVLVEQGLQISMLRSKLKIIEEKQAFKIEALEKKHKIELKAQKDQYEGELLELEGQCKIDLQKAHNRLVKAQNGHKAKVHNLEVEISNLKWEVTNKDSGIKSLKARFVEARSNAEQ